MPQGLSVNRVVDVTVYFEPIGAQLINFDTLLILGDSDVVDTGEVMREYNLIADVAADFGTTAPEYHAAALFFGQQPPPSSIFIGRWARTATSGLLAGGFLSPQQQLISNWVSVINGGFQIAIDGAAPVGITGINLAGSTNLNGVASKISTALTSHNATCVWTGQQFVIKSSSTGLTSSIGPLIPPTGGSTDLSAQMMMDAATMERTVSGVVAETPVACLARVDGRGWYACTFAASVQLADADHLACAAYIEAAEMHLYGLTTNAANVVDPASTADIASQLSLAEYYRTVGQWCSTAGPAPLAICSFFGRAFTTNFEGSDTTITMKFKSEPGVIPEVISATQANTIERKRFNVYATYENGVAILEQGVVSGPAYFDEIHGTDWLANRVQTDLFNILYKSPKIPQTNNGIQILVAGADGGLSQGVTNGLIAPGVWQAIGFGNLKYGDRLETGWYTWANSVDTQDPADRAQRIAPLIQIAIKLAGAVHSSDVIINVNR